MQRTVRMGLYAKTIGTKYGWSLYDTGCVPEAEAAIGFAVAAQKACAVMRWFLPRMMMTVLAFEEGLCGHALFVMLKFHTHSPIQLERCFMDVWCVFDRGQSARIYALWPGFECLWNIRIELSSLYRKGCVKTPYSISNSHRPFFHSHSIKSSGPPHIFHHIHFFRARFKTPPITVTLNSRNREIELQEILIFRLQHNRVDLYRSDFEGDGSYEPFRALLKTEQHLREHVQKRWFLGLPSRMMSSNVDQ